MKNRIILKLIVFLLLLPGWLFSQNLIFVQDPANNHYIEHDTLIEEVVYCGTSYNYFLNVTGGAQPLTYNWTVTNCIIGPNLTQLSTNGAVNPSSATIVVSDAQGDSIIKKIYFFNAPVLENLPATIENIDTTIILNQRPKSASVSGPGIYYNPTIAKYFYRPDSAGVGVHELVISIPNTMCNTTPQKTIQYTVTAQVVPELEIVGSPVWQYGVCSNDTLRLSTTAKGGQRPYTYSWRGVDIQYYYFVNDSTMIFNFPNFNIAPSTYQFFCDVSDNNGTVVTKTFYVTAITAPVVTLPTLPTEISISAAPIVINLAANHTVTGDGVVEDNGIYYFNPAIAGEGGKVIVFETFSGNCSAIGRHYINVINDVEKLVVHDSVQNKSVCVFLNDSLIVHSITGGVEPYHYTWESSIGGLSDVDSPRNFIYRTGYFGNQVVITCTVTDAVGQTAKKVFTFYVDYYEVFVKTGIPSTVYSDEPKFLITNSFEFAFVHKAIETDNSGIYFNPSKADIGINKIPIKRLNSICELKDTLVIEVFERQVNDEPLVVHDSIQYISVCSYLYDTLIVHSITGGIEPYHYSWESSIGGLTDEDSPENFIYRTGYFGEIVTVTCTVTDAIGQTAQKVFTFYVDYFISFDKTGIPTTVYNDDPTFKLTESFEFALIHKAIEINNSGIHFNPSKADIGTNKIYIKRINSVCDYNDSLVIEVIERFAENDMQIAFDPSQTLEICDIDTMYHYISASVSGGVAFSDGSYIVRLNGEQVALSSSYEIPVYPGIEDQIIEFEDVHGHIVSETVSVLTISATQVHLSNIYIEQGKSETVKTYPVNFETYIWNTGSTDSEIVVSEAGEYSVTVTDANGCVSSDKANVIVYTCTTTADFVVERVPGTVLDYEFTAQDEAELYYWSIPENISKTGKTFVHEFVNAISGEVCLTVYQGQFCSDTVCKQISFEPNGNLFSISGQVIGGDNFIRCGTAIAFEEVDGELVARGTSVITLNGSYRIVNLEEGSYTILAKPCDDSYEDTYFVNKTNPEDATMINLIGDATSVDIYLVEKTSTSIIESNSGSVSVFPCPMIDQSIISIDKGDATNVLFYDLTGKMVLEIIPQSSIISITKYELPSGTYTLMIKNNQKTIASQLFIVK